MDGKAWITKNPFVYIDYRGFYPGATILVSGMSSKEIVDKLKKLGPSIEAIAENEKAFYRSQLSWYDSTPCWYQNGKYACVCEAETGKSPMCSVFHSDPLGGINL